MKSESLSLKIVDVEDIDLCTIVCFSDACFANLKDNSSQSGYIIFLFKNYKSFSQIALKSRNKEWLKALFICKRMNRQVSEEFLPLKYCTDSKSLID